MKNITSIILTKNEELNIERCLKSIKLLSDRIIVIDSYSTDNTVEIAKQLGAEVYSNKFVDYATQFNWALDNTNINTKWVFRIDADECVPDELAQEIISKTMLHNSDDISGFVMKYKVYFMGKFLKHGGVYPFCKITIFKYGYGRFENRKMGEHIILSSGKSVYLKNDCLHYDFKSLDKWITKHNWYATRETLDYFEYYDGLKRRNKLSNKEADKANFLRNKIYYKLPMFLRAKLYFFYRYYIKFGFLDGYEGKIYAFLNAYWYRFIVDAKIYECKKMNYRYEETGDLKI